MPRPSGRWGSMKVAAAVASTALMTLASLVIGIAPAAADGATGGAAFGSGSATPAVTTQPATPATTGGIDPSAPVTTPAPAPGATATVDAAGMAHAPAGAPAAVKAIIASGNAIARKPYVWGGGHQRWLAKGYDCSGSVSYALHGAGILDGPLVSGDFMGWGDAGPGSWVTIYANRGHVFMFVAGLRFDTSGQRQTGTRWQADTRRLRGFRVRHPIGL